MPDATAQKYRAGTSASCALRVFTGVAVLGAALSLVLLGVRIYLSMSFSEPMQDHTTGDEFTQFYAIWRNINGQPVYTDRFSPPFYYAIYNWLFYESYGAFTGTVQRIMSLDDAWIPTISRYFSLLAMVFGGVGAYVAYARAVGEKNRLLTWSCWSFAIFIVAGPLVGYWNITARSDLWARTFEIAGVAFFLVFYPKSRPGSILLFVVCAYLAWAFKQGSVFAAGGVGLFLLARRDWKTLLLLSTLLPAAWAATLFFGEPQYLYNILFKDLPLFFSFGRLLRNIINFTVKSGPILFYLGALALLLVTDRGRRFKKLWRNDAFVVGLGGAMVAMAISIPGSAQLGGAENYFFTLSFFMGLVVMASLPMVVDQGGGMALWVLGSGAIGWGTLAAAILLVFAGVTGVIDLRHQSATYIAGKRCLDALPRPLFVNNPYLSLPWMTPGTTSFVVSYNYRDDRKAGHKFKDGGVGGLIEKGRFATIAISRSGPTPPDNLDGGSLAGYRLSPPASPYVKNCSRFYIFLRNTRGPAD